MTYNLFKARRIVGSYMGENTYVPILHEGWTKSEAAIKTNKYWTLIKKLTQLEPNDWSKFQEQLKSWNSSNRSTNSAKKKPTTNKERSNWIIKKHTKNLPLKHKPHLQRIKKISSKMKYWSPIHPPKIVKDRLKNLSPRKPKWIKQKPQSPIDQSRKIHMNTKVNIQTTLSQTQ